MILEFIKGINKKFKEFIFVIYSFFIINFKEIYINNSFNVIILYSSLLKSDNLYTIIEEINSEKIMFDTYYKNISFVIIVDDFNGKKNFIDNKDKVFDCSERFLGFYSSKEDFVERYKYIKNKKIDNIIEIRYLK